MPTRRDFWLAAISQEMASYITAQNAAACGGLDIDCFGYACICGSAQCLEIMCALQPPSADDLETLLEESAKAGQPATLAACARMLHGKGQDLREICSRRGLLNLCAANAHAAERIRRSDPAKSFDWLWEHSGPKERLECAALCSAACHDKTRSFALLAQERLRAEEVLCLQQSAGGGSQKIKARL